MQPDIPNALTRDAILGADDRPITPIDIPEWGGPVLLRGMTAAARASWEAEVIDPKTSRARDDVEARSRLAVRVLVNAAGERLFQDGEYTLLMGRSAAALSRIFVAALGLSRTGDAEVTRLLGESAAAPPSASSTASPRT